jgi:hypothetical protein
MDIVVVQNGTAYFVDVVIVVSASVDEYLQAGPTNKDDYMFKRVQRSKTARHSTEQCIGRAGPIARKFIVDLASSCDADTKGAVIGECWHRSKL